MPPQRVARGRPTRRYVKPQEQELPNGPQVKPQGKATNTMFREAIRIMSQAMTNQLVSKNEINKKGLTLRGFDMRSRMSYFLAGIGLSSSKEGRATKLIGDMDILRLMIYVEKVEKEKLRNREEFKNKRAKTRNESGQRKIMPTIHPSNRNRRGSMAQGGKPPACPNCGICPEGSTSCFKCTQMGHFMRESPTGRVSPRGATYGVEDESTGLVLTYQKKELNLRQKRRLELLKDSDMSILYLPGKANVVADALKRLYVSYITYLKEEKKELAIDVHRFARLGVRLIDSNKGGAVVTNRSKSSLVSEVTEKQDQNPICLS
ncbi:hypothetical protein EJD97_005968 [Solanum chilense]|uniref:Reverse transcriptase RNase H-like domain-containing protein n=1 Tax=Solanum chilense TaxID=4083 RepID=A0A6N2CCW4_SOLCI|nr:hypothetical protein EJD97_005968 [Solanum chilense]